MVNRQARSPGAVQRLDVNAQISDAPAFAVDTGSAWRALAEVGAQLGNRLGKMADAAAAREGDLAGLSAGQRAGESYLQHQSVTAAATATAAGLPGDIDGIVQAAAERYGVSADALRIVAKLESSGNPNAKNPNSSAGGLFQFVDGTAADYGLKNRYDPAEASDAAARLMRDNAAQLRAVLGREPTGAELYLAHQQGGGGASKLLANPNARAADLVGADAVRLNGGSKDMTAGEFSALWINKAGGTPATALPPALMPTSPRAAPIAANSDAPLRTEPLALRQDGTIRSEAFNAAANRAWGWRFEAGLTRDLGEAYEQFKDDPQGYAQASNDIVAKYTKDNVIATDPQAREAFDKTVFEKTEAARLDIAARSEARMRNEEIAAVGESLQSAQSDLERQAYTLGANPKADELLAPQLQRAEARISAALADNLITPAQANAQREGLAKAVFNSRIQGTFDALPTPSQKEAFALGLMDEWAKGEGPVARLELAQVKALSNTLFSQARQAQNQQTAAQKAETTRVAGLIADDLTSMATSGQGLDLDAAGITPEKVATLLGDEQLVEWQTKRDLARDTWLATSGMELETGQELTDRLTALKPVPGSAGYARQSEIYATAEKRARDLLEERQTDPLGQAHRGKLVELKPIDVSSPEALTDSLKLRRDQARQVAATYGTPVTIFRSTERSAIASALLDQPDLLPGFALSLTQSFGDLAPKALAELSEAGPEIAHAAGLQLATGDSGVATDVARVLAAKRDKTLNIKMPSDAQMTTAAQAIVGSALGQSPSTRGAVLNVADMLFQKEAAQLGFDPAEVKTPGSVAFQAYQRSIDRALGARVVNGVKFGGLAMVNGREIVAPTNMAADQVERRLHDLRASDLATLPPMITGNGVPITASDLANGQLLSIGDGQYAVALGDANSLTPQLVQGADGKPWVLDMYALEEMQLKRPVETNSGGPFGMPAFWR